VGEQHVRKEKGTRVEKGQEWGHTSFPFGECDMTSRFILDKFDLDLASSGFLLLWFVVFIVVVPSALASVMVVDERVAKKSPSSSPIMSCLPNLRRRSCPVTMLLRSSLCQPRHTLSRARTSQSTLVQDMNTVQEEASCVPHTSPHYPVHHGDATGDDMTHPGIAD
jgi:hypothetical protein